MRIIPILLLALCVNAEAGNRFANAYIAKAAQLGTTLTPLQKGAVSYLSGRLVSFGWDNFYWLYPFPGNNATIDNLNLISTGTYTATATGSITHNAFGVTGDGSTGFLNTGFNPSTVGVSTSSFVMAVYSRGPTPAGGTTRTDIGAQGAAADVTSLAWMIAGTIEGGRIAGSPSDVPQQAPTANVLHTGLCSIIVNGSRVATYYRDGAALAGTATMGGAFANQPLYILANDNNGTASNFSLKNLAIAYAKVGHDATTEARLYTVIEWYEGRLLRGGQ